jgi:glucose-1-phosphate thymidylyltransferase
MEGILLAGGLGKRLGPLTDHTNKHLLPVYNKRMIEYPIRSFVQAGITDVTIVVGGLTPGSFIDLLKDGKRYGLTSLSYLFQDNVGGIGAALSLVDVSLNMGHQPVAVILGDNYFDSSLEPFVRSWDGEGCKILLSRVPDPKHFGVAKLKDKKIVSLEEKPVDSVGGLAITGFYLFDHMVWDYLRKCPHSANGELEVVSVLQQYLNAGTLTYDEYVDLWSDMGTFENWMKISMHVMEKSNA